MKVKYKDKIYEVLELIIDMPEHVGPQRVNIIDVQIVADCVYINGNTYVLSLQKE